jgi:hypothetical protein
MSVFYSLEVGIGSFFSHLILLEANNNIQFFFPLLAYILDVITYLKKNKGPFSFVFCPTKFKNL